MKPSRREFIAAVSGALALGAETSNDLKLWYRQPARAWTDALPMGNGRLGGMVFGGIASERIALNEDTVWAGGRRDRNESGGPGEPPDCARPCSRAIPTRPRRSPIGR